MQSKITPDQIHLFDYDTFEDNSVMIDFQYNGVNYYEFIRPKDVERCAKDWLTETCPEGETIEKDFEAFMEKNCNGHSQLEIKHAIELAIFYLKENEQRN